MKALIAIVLTILAPLQKPGKIETSYDKFKDRTTVEIDYMRVYGSDWDFNTLEIAARLSYPGKQQSKPSSVTLFFFSKTRQWRFQSEPELRAIVDGERVRLGQTVFTDRDIHTDRYSVSVREYLAIAIPFETFQKLAASQSVEMQLGTIEFALNTKTLTTFRELARRVQ